MAEKEDNLQKIMNSIQGDTPVCKCNKPRPVLVYYISVATLTPIKAVEYLNNVIANYTLDTNDEYLQIFAPTQSKESKVELLNPNYSGMNSVELSQHLKNIEESIQNLYNEKS